MNNKPSALLLSLAVAAALAGCQKTETAAPAGDADKAAPTTTAAELPPTAAFAIADLDTSKDVCDDLNAFANSKWLAAHPVPSDRTTWGSFEMLDERSEVASRNIAEAAAADADASGTA
jgi:putative endopeptidase